MGCRRVLLLTTACAACLALAPSAWGGPAFRPRVGGAMGLVPPVTSTGVFASPELQASAHKPATYHGGQVMAGGITVHAIFWGPAGSFPGSPRRGVLSYERLVAQFFVDIARDSGRSSNVYSTLIQYAEGTKPGAITPGKYAISFKRSRDMVIDTHPYPASGRCTSPSKKIHTCVTDAQVQREIGRLIARSHGRRGLHNLWFVFLPPKVDECISKGVCGTNSFAGYHAVSDLGHGAVIYAIAIDPAIEGPVPNHQDPEGFPSAESTIDTAAHETEEAITDPQGVGWMGPNGFEVGDKCERPVLGKPLGHAPDGAPYNQLIAGHEYLFQEMWSNDQGRCVQRTHVTANPLPLPQVDLVQFSPRVAGNIERRRARVHVTVKLVRGGPTHNQVTVASASTTTAGDGGWSLSLAPHAVGDDRDEIIVEYAGPGAPDPHRQAILTGNGGNAYTESGWTGWTEMDNGSRASNHPPSVAFGPCFQTGVEQYTIAGVTAPGSPTRFCNTKRGVATALLSAPLRPGQAVTWSANDNRAFSPPTGPAPNPHGGLVKLTVPVGEPGSVSLFSNPIHKFFTQGGFPTCTADLVRQTMRCAGLVPGRRYTLHDSSRRAAGFANSKGVLFHHLAVKQGDVVGLSNGSRTITRLHVAHLHVTVKGNGKTASGGRCQPGEYYGPPLAAAPINRQAG
ncbi:MAG: hypothetical protein JO240_00795, partial [Solirubrobacterales bacterium]|nr:hypothetical protein [Solirubrobacterales bacterium]